jgi:hypothetical protein
VRRRCVRAVRQHHARRHGPHVRNTAHVRRHGDRPRQLRRLRPTVLADAGLPGWYLRVPVGRVVVRKRRRSRLRHARERSEQLRQVRQSVQWRYGLHQRRLRVSQRVPQLQRDLRA